MKRFRRVLAGICVALLAVGVLAIAFSSSSHAATIVRVVDGDTVDVMVKGEQVRVRLLNIDAPESVDPKVPDECLGAEAAAHLRELLPVGAEVRLEMDAEPTDGYGRTLAGVFIDGVLVNAAMAEAGLAIPMKVGENTLFYETVVEAWASAEQARAGLLSPDIECTIPGQVASAMTRIEELPAEPADSGIAALEAHAAAMTAELVAADALLHHLNRGQGIVFRAVGDVRLGALVGIFESAHSDLTERSTQADAAVAAERQRLEEIRLAEEAAAREAAEAAARQAAEAAARQAAEPAANNQNQGYAPPAYNPPANSGRPGNAAPCRRYAPGGKTFIYIDCVTKQPI